MTDEPTVHTGGGTAGDDEATRAGAAPRSRPASGGLSRGEAFGRYVLLERVGAGGMGVVWAAYDPELDRRVALKLLRPAFAGTVARQRLVREAQAMARLNHPNVVTVHDVGAVDKQPYLTMEYVAGEPLDRWLRRADHPWRERLSVLVAAGRGLAAAHRAGLVHRDFKPGNVLVGDDGRVRVTDFGLARAASATEPSPAFDVAATLTGDAISASDRTPALSAPMTVAGTLVGTPRYMAPEQVVERRADARSDQFAFCATLYEALFGESPFGDAEGGELLRRIAAAAVPSPPSLPGLPARVRRALLRGLAADPDARFPDMDTLLAELAHDPAARRRRLVMGLLAAAAVAAAGAALLQYTAHRSSLCSDGAARFAGTWDAGRDARVSARFGATGAPFAADAARQVTAALAGYGTRWAAAYGEACAATRLRGEHSEAVLDRRMACLDQRLREVDRLAALLEGADAELVGRADEAVAGLRQPAACLDTAALLTEVPLPTDTATRAHIDEQEKALADATAHRLAGDYQGARDLAAGVAAAAGDLAYPPLLADALAEVGNIDIELGDGDGAAAALDGSLAAAERGGSDARALSAIIELVWLNDMLSSDLPAAERWARLGAAKLERLGHPPDQSQELLAARAALAEYAGRYDEALTLYRKELEIVVRTDGPDSLAAASAENQLANAYYSTGDYETALAHYRRSAELKQRHLGAHHPSLATTLVNVGSTLSYLQRYDEAETTLAHALAMEEEAFGRNSPNLATCLNNIAYVQEGQHHYEAALATHARALALARAAWGPDHPQVAYSLLNRVSVERQLGRFAAGLTDAREADRILSAALGPDHPTTAYAANAIGMMLLLQGHAAAAVPQLERAVRIREAATTDPVLLAETRHNLARALWDAGSDRARARRLAVEARQALAAAGERGADALADVEQWLRTHGGP